MSNPDKRPVLEWWVERQGPEDRPRWLPQSWKWSAGKRNAGARIDYDFGYWSVQSCKRGARRWLKRYCSNCDLRFVE